MKRYVTWEDVAAALIGLAVGVLLARLVLP